MSQNENRLSNTIARDSLAGVIVFLVALPLCLGIALASNAPLFSGLIAGIVGGILVGALSGSHTSVSGPAAGLTAIVSAQIANLGTFDAFLLAVVIGGVIQIILGIAQAGALSAFFPTSVIKGLLAAIGVILILKQIPHLFGHDTDPEGEMSFRQPDDQTTFSELLTLIGGDICYSAAVIGLLSLAVLILWDRIKPLKNFVIPAPLFVVIMGVLVGRLFTNETGRWLLEASHLVQVPVSESIEEFVGFFQRPDFSQIGNPTVYIAGITIAIVASLETLLNLEAVDKLDTQRRHSPPSRELLAQGIGNVTAGMIGGLPMTSVIIRSSVNVGTGAKTKMSAIFHGILLLVCVMQLPNLLNMIPLSSLAAILLVTGFKLASPKLFRQMWRDGYHQFVPFIITLVAIVLTDLLIGIVIGLCVSIIFILAANLRRPIRRIVERHVGGEVLHIELANQVSFLNRAAIDRTLREIPSGAQVFLDARRTDYFDPDVLGLIREFRDVDAPARDIQVSLRGFREQYNLDDEIQFVDYSTRELQEQLTPAKVLQLLHEGNVRFRTGRSLDRDFRRQPRKDLSRQHPMAVFLSGTHSRVPAEVIFDLGLGDIFNIRIGGNVVGPKVTGCTEYGCAVAGAKLILVMGHTESAMISLAIRHKLSLEERDILEDCPNLQRIVDEIGESADPDKYAKVRDASADEIAEFEDEVARRNVQHSINKLLDSSKVIHELVNDGRVAAIGAMYDMANGEIEFLADTAVGLTQDDVRQALEMANTHT